MLCCVYVVMYGQEGYCVVMVYLNKGDDVWVRYYGGEGIYLYFIYVVLLFLGYLIKVDQYLFFLYKNVIINI